MRAAVFAHFDIHGVLDDHVLFALRCYRPYFDIIYLVSSAELDSEQMRRGGWYADKVILRENIGYDFMSWKVGFDALPTKICSEIAFINDSCYGPCHDPKALFDWSSRSSADLWGVSINDQFASHVQSFFMVFRSSLLASGFAQRFWSSIEIVDNKSELINLYEVGLSQAAVSAGFVMDAISRVDSFDSGLRSRIAEDNILPRRKLARDTINLIESSDVLNPMHLCWNESLRNGNPLLKVELVRDNPLGVNLYAVMQALRNGGFYNPRLIEQHLRRVLSRAAFARIQDVFSS